jgi:DNA (cytosine-5)-methyltransferase 1
MSSNSDGIISNSDDLSKLSKQELLKKCDELSITKVKSKNKTQLIKLIMDKIIMIVNSSRSNESNRKEHSNGEEHKSSLKFIDLFCGIGGFHQALSKLNYKCVFACDIDVNCRLTYKANYGIEPECDITQIDEKNIPDFDILCAGFPCQPFSKAGFQNGFQDTRGTLFYDICRITKHHKPKYLILENVRNLESHDNGNTWNIIYKEICDMGYTTYKKPLILNTLQFNIPQNRERVIILCKRNDLGDMPKYPIIPKIDKSDVNVSLHNIVDKKYNTNANSLSEKLINVKNVWNEFIHMCYDNNIKIPKFPIWTEYWDSTVDNTKYKNWIDKNRLFYSKHKNVLDGWLIKSRKNKHWIGAMRKLEWQTNTSSNDLDSLLWSCRGSGIRVKDANYVPTLVAMNQTPIYGFFNRKLVPEELLKLQSFDDTFKFNKKHIYKQLGNAINVDVIYKCANFLINQVGLFET